MLAFQSVCDPIWFLDNLKDLTGFLDNPTNNMWFFDSLTTAIDNYLGSIQGYYQEINYDLHDIIYVPWMTTKNIDNSGSLCTWSHTCYCKKFRKLRNIGFIFFSIVFLSGWKKSPIALWYYMWNWLWTLTVNTVPNYQDSETKPTQPKL